MILQQGNTIFFSDKVGEKIDHLPAKNMLLKLTADGFVLELSDDFVIPEKVYGNVYEQAERYLNTFSKRKKNLGILLRGEKGTGKSLLAKIICVSSGLPVIMVTENFTGDGFKSFLANIKQDCIIFIDEFEKVYKSGSDNSLVKKMPFNDSQESILSIMDGIFENKKMFLFTANNDYTINKAMMNRPGRIHYLRKYESLSEEVIDEVIKDRLVNKDNKDDLLEVCTILGEINMDALISIIEEMNMYQETAREAISQLNIEPEDTDFEVEFRNDVNVYDRESKCDISLENHLLTGELRKNPLLKKTGYLHFYIQSKEDPQRYSMEDGNHHIDMSMCKIKVNRNKTIQIYDEQHEILYNVKRKPQTKKFVF